MKRIELKNNDVYIAYYPEKEKLCIDGYLNKEELKELIDLINKEEYVPPSPTPLRFSKAERFDG